MSALDLATDALFEDPNTSDAVLWRPGGAIEGIPARVRLPRPRGRGEVDFGRGRLDLPALLIAVRLAEVPDPQVGDLVQFVDQDDRIAEITGLSEINVRETVRTFKAAWDEDSRFPAVER